MSYVYMGNGPALLVYCPRQEGGVRNVTDNLFNALVAKHSLVYREESLWGVVSRAIKLRRAGVRVWAVLSLGAGICVPFFERTVYILHGFPVRPYYSRIRTLGVNIVPKFVKAHGGKLVAVSYLVRNVYQRIYGMSVDEVVFNGCSARFHELSNQYPKKKKQILYLGRLERNKGLSELVAAFKTDGIFASLGYSLVIAGDGPVRDELAQKCFGCADIRMLGAVTDDQKQQLFSESEVFVSLNDFEPMGVVYVEAMLSRCKIVMPYACGAGDFVPCYYPHVKCQPGDIESVRLAIAEVINDNASASLEERDRALFSYENIGSRYLKILSALGSSAS